MNSEMIWDILKFPNFEYFEQSATTYSSMVQPYEKGPASLSQAQASLQPLHCNEPHLSPSLTLWKAKPDSDWLGHTQKAAPYSSMV